MARPKLLGPYQIVEPLSESADVQRWVARIAAGGSARRVELIVAKTDDAGTLVAKARGLERLEHPNSRAVVDYGLLEGRYYLALDDSEPTIGLGNAVLPDSVVLEVGLALCGVLNHCQVNGLGFELLRDEIALTTRGDVRLAGARLGGALPTLQAVAQLLAELCGDGPLRELLDRVAAHGRAALARDDDDDDDDSESDFAAFDRELEAIGAEIGDPISVAGWVTNRRGTRGHADSGESAQLVSSSAGDSDEEEAETLVASLSSFAEGHEEDAAIGMSFEVAVAPSADDDDEHTDGGSKAGAEEDTKVGFVQDAVDGIFARATVVPKPSPDAALRPRDDEQPVLPVDWEDLGEPPTVAFDNFAAIAQPLVRRRATVETPVAEPAEPASAEPVAEPPQRAEPLDPDAPLPPREVKTGMRRVPTREVSITREESQVALRPRRPPTDRTAAAAAPHGGGGGLMRLTTRDVRRQRRPINARSARTTGSVVSVLPQRPGKPARRSKTKTRIDRSARLWLLVAVAACGIALLAAVGIYLLL